MLPSCLGLPGREPKRQSFHATSGFTVLEMIAVLVVVLIIATLILPNASELLRRAGEARCAANMRSIAIGLRGYLLDHENIWPQGPTPEDGAAFDSFWLGVLQPQGISSRTWQCPTIAAQAGPDGPQVHYAPTLFPPTPGIANRWATHPWLIERADAHGRGALVCFPDGSVKSFHKILAETGIR